MFVCAKPFQTLAQVTWTTSVKYMKITLKKGFFGENGPQILDCCHESLKSSMFPSSLACPLRPGR